MLGSKEEAAAASHTNNVYSKSSGYGRQAAAARAAAAGEAVTVESHNKTAGFPQSSIFPRLAPVARP